jgi:hypothetical protein
LFLGFAATAVMCGSAAPGRDQGIAANVVATLRPATLQPATLAPTPVPPTLRPAALPASTLPPVRSTPQPAATPFDPRNFIGQGDRYNCPNFASQAQAQAVLRADPSDPNGLDADKDGIACERNPGPKDLVKVPRF